MEYFITTTTCVKVTESSHMISILLERQDIW